MKKSFSILLFIFIIFIILRLIGVTYGFYHANILGNINDVSISLTAKKLSVQYTDGTSIMNFEGDYFFPGDKAEKTFSVTNTGDSKAEYSILIRDVINDFERIQDLKYTLYLNEELLTSGTINNNNIQYLFYNQSIDAGITHQIRFVFEYATTSESQNVDMDKTISFRFDIDNVVGKKLESSDNSISFVGSNVKNYKIYGNSIQDGIPTPDNPVEIQSVGDLVTDESDENYGKYKMPVKVSGKNLLPNSTWMSGQHQTGFNEFVGTEYITEYTSNSISFNLPAWSGVSSPRFPKDSVKRIMFKINQNAVADEYINFYIVIQGYDDDNNKVGNQIIYNNAIADTKYVFDFSKLIASSFYKTSTQFSFCILSRKNPINDLKIYDVAYYNDTNTTEYEPYVEPKTYNIYLDEPLRKIRNRVDYIDFENGKVVRNTKKIELTSGSVDASIYSYNGTKGVHFPAILEKKYGRIAGMCNRENDIGDYYSGYGNHYMWIGVENTYVYWCGILDYLEITTINEFKTWLSNNPTYIIVPLATSTEKTIELPTILPNEDINNILSINTTISPSNIELEYNE